MSRYRLLGEVDVTVIKPKEEINWVSSRQALQLLSSVLDRHSAKEALLKRAHNDLIRTKARHLVSYLDDRRQEKSDAEIRPQFFWAENNLALHSNWDTGDFSTYIHDGRFEGGWEVIGLQFDRDGIDALLTESAPLADELPVSLQPAVSAQPLPVSAAVPEASKLRRGGPPFNHQHFYASARVTLELAGLSAEQLLDMKAIAVGELLVRHYSGSGHSEPGEENRERAGAAILKALRRAD